MTDLSLIGMKIQKLRKERGLSQEDLAFEAGIARHHLSRIENANTSLKVSTLIAIAEALNVKPGDLFN